MGTSTKSSYAQSSERIQKHAWAHPAYICTGTGLTPATSTPDRDWAHPGHICTGTQPRARPLGKPVPYLAPGLKAEG